MFPLLLKYKCMVTFACLSHIRIQNNKTCISFDEKDTAIHSLPKRVA